MYNRKNSSLYGVVITADVDLNLSTCVIQNFNILRILVLYGTNGD